MAIGLGFLRAVNAIESDLDLFVGIVQNGDGIAVGDVDDLCVEVSVGERGNKNQQ